MGGGSRKFPEVRKKLGRVAPQGQDLDPSGMGSGRPQGLRLEEPICEREQVLSVRLTDEVAPGAEIRVVAGDPPTVASGKATIGTLSDPRQAATILACIGAGFRVVGQVVTVDPELGEAFVSAVGVRVP